MFQTVGHLIIYSPPPQSNPGALPFSVRKQPPRLHETVELEVVLVVGEEIVRTVWVGALPDTEMARGILELDDPRVCVRCESRLVAIYIDIDDIRALAEQEVRVRARERV